MTPFQDSYDRYLIHWAEGVFRRLEDRFFGYLITARLGPFFSGWSKRNLTGSQWWTTRDKTPILVAWCTTAHWPAIVSTITPGTVLIHWYEPGFHWCLFHFVDKKDKWCPNRGGGAAGAKPLVSVFIGSWINMAFLIQKGSAVMDGEYLSLPPGPGVHWQGRCWYRLTCGRRGNANEGDDSRAIWV